MIVILPCMYHCPPRIKSGGNDTRIGVNVIEDAYGQMTRGGDPGGS